MTPRVIIMRRRSEPDVQLRRMNYMRPYSDRRFLFELSLVLIGCGAVLMSLGCAAYLVLDWIGWL